MKLGIWDWLLVLFGVAPSFKETVTPAGTPNLVRFGPNLWRMGQPPSAKAWSELRELIAPNGEPVAVVKLNDPNEGSDMPVLTLGWSLVTDPIPPEDDKPWTIVVKPEVAAVHEIVSTIVAMHQKGLVVAWHCTHGRDRTGLVAALVGRALYGWSKREMAKDMIEHGFRWVDVNLTEYFEENA